MKKGSDIGNHVTVKAAGGSWNAEQYAISASGSTDSGLGLIVSATKERRGEYKFKNANGKSQLLKNSGYDDTGVIVKLDQRLGRTTALALTLSISMPKAALRSVIPNGEQPTVINVSAITLLCVMIGMKAAMKKAMFRYIKITNTLISDPHRFLTNQTLPILRLASKHSRILSSVKQMHLLPV